MLSEKYNLMICLINFIWFSLLTFPLSCLSIAYQFGWLLGKVVTVNFSPLFSCLYAFCFRGNDFRPQYRRSGELRSFFPDNVWFLAFTATDTKQIRKHVFCRSLLTVNSCILNVLSGRQNIYYEVQMLKWNDLISSTGS